MPISPAFLFTIEDAMRVVASREYERILRRGLWWRFVAGVVPSRGRSEFVAIMLDDAGIMPSDEGQVVFDDIALSIVEYENEHAGAGLRMSLSQLEDHDANGLQIAANWSRGIAARAAYWPQKLVAACLIANPRGYDGKALFALDHPVHPFDPSKGTFRNLFTGSASGTYPGAVPITGGTLDQARTNLRKALSYISEIPLPNGAGSRCLKVTAMICPPALMERAQQVTGAQVLSRMDGHEREPVAVLRNVGMPEPIEAPELAAKWPGGSDTSFYLAVEEAGHDELGAVAFVERQPFTINFHGPDSDATLSRTREVEWIVQGRNTVGPAHPYLIFRCDAT